MSYTTSHLYALGAKARLEGITITQSQKELDRYDHDGRSETRRGWIAMDEMLILQNLINLAKARSS